MKAVNIRMILILAFQLVIIFALVGFGTMYVKRMAAHSEDVIKDNLRSVRYCSSMRKTLYQLKVNPDNLSLRTDFENNLQSELNNITEPGEGYLANQIKDEYFLWLKIPRDTTFNEAMRDIDSVSELNINAIEKRNQDAQNTAASADNSIILLGFSAALIAFIFTFTFIGALIRKKTT